MFPSDGKTEIVLRISEMDTFLDTYSHDMDKPDKELWVGKYEEEINALTKGLKKICFDCGEMSKYGKYEKDILWSWQQIKKKYLPEKDTIS